MNQAVSTDEIEETALSPVLALSATLLLGWSFWALVIFPQLVDTGGEESAISSIGARVLFWLIPTGCYLHRYWGRRWAQPIGLDFPLGAPQVVRTVVLTLVVSAFFVVGTAAQLGTGAGDLLERLAGSLSFSLTAPILEEVVFRGVVLSELINWARDSSKGLASLRLRFWVGMILAAVVFVLVHWPFWIAHFGVHATLLRSVPLLAFSLVVGFVFANTRSIWACIFLHYLNNQLSMIVAT